ncbi:hypothetical protein B0I31_12757 [Saccharothrix carnea]|uniref:Uncharacterized protein n=1 Tax=Saccharothrix carnea TaxID=1280637 RepID=A0A2P8HGF8_SACCR|nr:hypothetical protein [Saccharothrix carnea]PSL45280.1 hypothetical protein B0I31_12757 [Saccharothrix carnea]
MTNLDLLSTFVPATRVGGLANQSVALVHGHLMARSRDWGAL